MADAEDDLAGGRLALPPMASLKSFSVRGAVEKQLTLPLNVAKMNSSCAGPHLPHTHTHTRIGVRKTPMWQKRRVRW